MPKLKTHKGTAKRFRLTKTGRVKRWRNGKRHLLVGKDPKRLRKLRKSELCAPADARKVRRLLAVE